MTLGSCTETYYPVWSAQGIRGVRCTRPAKGEALVRPYADGAWEPKCGIHLRRYERVRRTVIVR